MDNLNFIEEVFLNQAQQEFYELRVDMERTIDEAVKEFESRLPVGFNIGRISHGAKNSFYQCESEFIADRVAVLKHRFKENYITPALQDILRQEAAKRSVEAEVKE